MSTAVEDSPGVSPAQIFEVLDDQAAVRLLPKGAYNLIKTLRPQSLTGPERHQTLGKLFSVELAIDDPERRVELLSALPDAKVKELEKRVGVSFEELFSSSFLSSRTRREVLGFYGVSTLPERPVVTLEANLEVQASYGLFPHQKKAAVDIERYLYFEDGRVMLHLPTGVGKTRTAMSVVASHLRSRQQALVIWLASSQELLEQAANEFEATWHAIGDRPIKCHRFWSNYEAPPEDLVDGIVIAGLAKLHSYGKVRKHLWSLGDRVSFVVFDEAHQAVATTYKDLVETLVTRNPRTGLLGLSATPGRTWNEPHIDEALAELFFGNKVTLNFGTENPIERLTRDGYISRVSFSLLNVKPRLHLSAQDIDELTKTLDVPESLAEVLGEDEQRNIRIIQHLLELIEHHDRILVFAASVSNARLLCSVCRALGLQADVVTGTTDKVSRRHSIERFRRLDMRKRVLINFGVLTTGFDAPAASAALVARPTRSLVLYSQMIGRIIRGPKAGGTTDCEVVTVVDTTLPGFGDVAEAFINWEDIWTP
ncbi:MAG: DEAD/DEAH box helicase family protein [Acidimicrobiaceae bacterium]|nr:DEAD/DEAH box helicase family protein [Acidimicrobiaceae bacterium]